MSMLSANELKTRGVSAVEEGLKDKEELIISVRGKQRYVVMEVEKYHRLRDLEREFELTSAVEEARADYAAQRFTTESVADHVQRLKNGD